MVVRDGASVSRQVIAQLLRDGKPVPCAKALDGVKVLPVAEVLGRRFDHVVGAQNAVHVVHLQPVAGVDVIVEHGGRLEPRQDDELPVIEFAREVRKAVVLGQTQELVAMGTESATTLAGLRRPSDTVLWACRLPL